MKAQHDGKKWVVTFSDCEGNKQQTVNSSLQAALSMMFINRTTAYANLPAFLKVQNLG